MLDCFEIISSSGVVLWSRSFTPVKPSIINAFIKHVFIEGAAAEAGRPAGSSSASASTPYRSDRYTIEWTSQRDLGLIFVAVYQSILHLSWVDKLLANIKTLFTTIYKDRLTPQEFISSQYDFTPYFDQQLAELSGNVEAAINQNADIPQSQQTQDIPEAAPYEEASQARQFLSTPDDTPDTSRPSTPASSGPFSTNSVKQTRRGRKAAAAQAASRAEDRQPSQDAKGTKGGKAQGKQMRRWNDDGTAGTHSNRNLDYSTDTQVDPSQVAAANEAAADHVNPDQHGIRTSQGHYILQDLSDEVHGILESSQHRSSQPQTREKDSILGSGLTAISGMFRNVVGGKVLTAADLQKPMTAVQEHLLKKNVARDAAVRLCQGVESQLVGSKTGSFESVEASIQIAMKTALAKMLTPTTSLDLLRAIDTVARPSTRNPLAPTARPYVISVVGVNGVGKSTNLSKLAFFLLQNDLKLLIAACDTFRSGAVQQLRVHADNLKQLTSRSGRGNIELFERGYGGDPAKIARQAISYAANEHFDVVLIDTAGRRHNDASLMGSLENFAQSARPDKIFMVGEALVGSDSLAQARNFDKALGRGRGLDGFIISKCDTVGDMIGTLVSMVNETGIPIVFLGVGQHYGDLRTLNVDWAVKLLMS